VSSSRTCYFLPFIDTTSFYTAPSSDPCLALSAAKALLRDINVQIRPVINAMGSMTSLGKRASRSSFSQFGRIKRPLKFHPAPRRLKAKPRSRSGDEDSIRYISGSQWPLARCWSRGRFLNPIRPYVQDGRRFDSSNQFPMLFPPRRLDCAMHQLAMTPTLLPVPLRPLHTLLRLALQVNNAVLHSRTARIWFSPVLIYISVYHRC
jgi:hypothetical protein